MGYPLGTQETSIDVVVFCFSPWRGFFPNYRAPSIPSCFCHLQELGERMTDEETWARGGDGGEFGAPRHAMFFYRKKNMGKRNGLGSG